MEPDKRDDPTDSVGADADARDRAVKTRDAYGRDPQGNEVIRDGEKIEDGYNGYDPERAPQPDSHDQPGDQPDKGLGESERDHDDDGKGEGKAPSVPMPAPV